MDVLIEVGSAPGDPWFGISDAIAVVAVLIAIGSLLVAVRARRDVQKYRDASWELRHVIPTGPWTILQFDLANIGDTRAKDVRIAFDVDPTEVFVTVDGTIAVGDHRMWSLIQPGGHGRLNFNRVIYPDSVLLSLQTFDQQIASDANRNGATVEWTNVLGQRCRERVEIPRFSGEWRERYNEWEAAQLPPATS